MYLIFLSAMMAQFIAHFSDVWINERFGNGWIQILKYMVGVIVNAPFLDMAMNNFGIPKRHRKIVMLLYLATFVCGGLGTWLGWNARPSHNQNGGNT